MDTYFSVRTGRLKLRGSSHVVPDGQISVGAELIRYERPDGAGARVSRYERLEVRDVETVRAELGAEHGVRGSVRKRRELWTLDSTRIHLDRVEGLGDFVELETVCDGTPTPAEVEEHDRLFAGLDLDPHEAVRTSYIDLLEPAASLQ